MLRPEDLLEAVKSGNDIHMRRRSTGRREVIVVERITGLERVVELGADEYEALMTAFVDDLAGEAGGAFGVAVRMDYFGHQWVEVTSGRLLRVTSRVSLSPQRIAALSERMRQRSRTDP